MNVIFVWCITIYISDCADGTLQLAIQRTLNHCLYKEEVVTPMRHCILSRKWPKHDWGKKWILQIYLLSWQLLTWFASKILSTRRVPLKVARRRWVIREMDRMKICYNFRAVNYCENSIQFQLIDQSTGVFRCEKCNKDYPNFMYRLLASVCIASFEFYMKVSLFRHLFDLLL